MTQTPRDVTAAELAILQQLWTDRSSSIKQLASNLYGASTPSDIATVQKLLARLEAKGYVDRDRTQWPHQFRATVGRDHLISHRLQTTADELCDGTMSTLLSHLVQSKGFDAAERQRLRRLLDDLEQSS